MLAQKGEPMKKAIKTLIHISEDDEARAKALAHEKWVRDQAELKAEGIEEGQTKGMAKVIRQMHASGMPIADIARITELSEEKIKTIIQ